jgi:hypothetical protein
MKILLHLSSQAERSEGKGIQTSLFLVATDQFLDPLPSPFGLARGDKVRQLSEWFGC